MLLQFGAEYLRKVRSVKIGIAGAGGLGSNCACNLVRSGFDNLKIADFDNVEVSNLNRQFYFQEQLGMPKVKALEESLKRINPSVKVEALIVRLEKENIKNIFADCDIIVEAFDRAEYKTILVEEMLSDGKFIVSASGLSGIGSSDDMRVNRIKENLVVVGDLKSDAAEVPPISPRVNIAAAKQADVILEHVLGLD